MSSAFVCPAPCRAIRFAGATECPGCGKSVVRPRNPIHEHNELRKAIEVALSRTGAVYLWENEVIKARLPSGAYKQSCPAGTADILGVVKGGRFLAIEVKTGKARPTKEQRDHLAKVNAMGGLGIVARSVDEALSAVVNALSEVAS